MARRQEYCCVFLIPLRLRCKFFSQEFTELSRLSAWSDPQLLFTLSLIRLCLNIAGPFHQFHSRQITYLPQTGHNARCTSVHESSR